MTPNLLTVGRIACIPVLVGMFYLDGEWGRWTACLVFGLAATTDYVGCCLARDGQQ